MQNTSGKKDADQYGYSLFASMKASKKSDIYVRFDDLYSKNDWNIAKDEHAAIIGAQIKLNKYAKPAPNFRMYIPKADGAKKEYSTYVNSYFGLLL